jgi:hypothetical protein
MVGLFTATRFSRPTSDARLLSLACRPSAPWELEEPSSGFDLPLTSRRRVATVAGACSLASPRARSIRLQAPSDRCVSPSPLRAPSNRETRGLGPPCPPTRKGERERRTRNAWCRMVVHVSLDP